MNPNAGEHLDVLVVGAGLSGIAAGHYLQADCPWATYAIFEARSSIGGTWDLFRYPGVRSDSDMFTLGYPFRPWQGHQAIADGSDILDYIVDTAREEGIDEHIRFDHRVESISWSSADAVWYVVAHHTDPDSGEQTRVSLTASFVFSCSGYYRYDKGHTPEFAGRDRFTGTMVHPQFWPDDLDVNTKNVVVIGSGATAVTLVPALARTARHVTMLQRSPTYVAAVPDVAKVANFLRKRLPERTSTPTIRWMKALQTIASYKFSRRFPNAMRKLLAFGAKSELPDGFDVDTHFNPSYDPWDQRLCAVPNGDLFASIRSGDASVVTDHVDTLTATGIQLQSGEHLDADVIVTATGLEILFLGGIQIDVDGDSVDISEKVTYKGMMLEGVPNLAMAIGYTNSSWTLKCDLICREVMRINNHMRATGMRQAQPQMTDDASSAEPLLELTSGYVQRAAAALPKQGVAFPWRVYQSYLADYRAMRSSPVDNDAMRFTNPAAASRDQQAPADVADPDVAPRRSEVDDHRAQPATANH